MGLKKEKSERKRSPIYLDKLDGLKLGNIGELQNKYLSLFLKTIK